MTDNIARSKRHLRLKHKSSKMEKRVFFDAGRGMFCVRVMNHSHAEHKRQVYYHGGGSLYLIIPSRNGENFHLLYSTALFIH